MTENKEKAKDKPLLEVTEAAIAKIKEMQAKEDKEGFGLRVGVVTGGCAGLSYDLRFQKKPYDNDIVLSQGGVDVYINEESVPFLKGCKLHYVDTLKESGFKYINPNANTSCGCGFSFS